MSILSRQAETMRRVLGSFALDLHVAMPGRVRSYDAAAQTAEIEIQVRRVIPSADETEDDTTEDYPILPNVPVLWPRGGGAYLHFPLAEGDKVLVVFSEADLGQWRATGETVDPGLSTRHGLSGGVALPGIHWQGNPNPDADATAWRLGMEGGPRINGTDTVIEVGGNKALAESSPVQAQLDALWADLQAVNTAIPSGISVPALGLTFATVKNANPIATSVTKGD